MKLKRYFLIATVLTVGFLLNVPAVLGEQVFIGPHARLHLQGTGENPAKKPYLGTLTTPSGVNILRDGADDHPHHHGLMFAVKVDGVNFWEEGGAGAGREIVTNSKTEIDGSNMKNELDLAWKNGKDVELVTEKRKVNVLTDVIPDALLVDWTSTFTLPKGKDQAELGGNHYHGLGMRFVESMDKDGRFFSSEKDAADNEVARGGWLTRCRWMAYTAKAESKPVTVAVFDISGNPQVMLAYTKDEPFAYLGATCNLHREPLTLTLEKPISFRYGVAVWDGEQSYETVDKAYRVWENHSPGGKN